MEFNINNKRKLFTGEVKVSTLMRNKRDIKLAQLKKSLIMTPHGLITYEEYLAECSV